jgi:hypothetical protein
MLTTTVSLFHGDTCAKVQFLDVQLSEKSTQFPGLAVVYKLHNAYVSFKAKRWKFC